MSKGEQLFLPLAFFTPLLSSPLIPSEQPACHCFCLKKMIKYFTKRRPDASPQFKLLIGAPEKNKMNLNLAPTFPALPRAFPCQRRGEQHPADGLVWSLECGLTPEAGLFVGVPESQPVGVVTLRKEGHWVVGEGKQAKLALVELPHLLLLCSFLP